MTEAVAPVNESSRLVDSLDAAVGATFSAILGGWPSFVASVEDSTRCPRMVGIIAVIGDVSWSLSLGFPPETAARMAEKFAGFEIEYDSEDMGDVIGELANVLAGDVVAKLDELGIKVGMSLPTVARVSDLHLLEPSAVQSLRFRYSSTEGEFVVGLAMGKPLR